jgi:uncharacterized FAD-dependent dehydrogenase
MIKITNIKLPFDHPDQTLWAEAAKVLKIPEKQILEIKVQKRSLDARRGRPLLRVYSLLVEVNNEPEVLRKHARNPRISLAPEYLYRLPAVLSGRSRLRPIVVGTGPAGLFAGLILAEAGLEPILLERGKPVQERSKDTDRFWLKGILNPESNVQFGEGGAGTYSDGKLQTRIKDKLNRDKKILQELVEAGAPGEILSENKPHLGTDNLVGIVQKLREKINRLGGDYQFEAKMEDLLLDNNKLTGVQLSDGRVLKTQHLILAVGHSARDTFLMLERRGVKLAPKPFSVGFRIEHPQEIINRNQYGDYAEHPALDAADYQLAYHTSCGRTVYSFCMCPGGSVIAASSEPGGVVTNGMSQYARQEVNANSAIVAEVYPVDFGPQDLAGMEFQRVWERKAFQAGGGEYFAPVQLVGDFLEGKKSVQLGDVKPSYLPGIRLENLRELFPTYVIEAILEALPAFEAKIEGFSRQDALLTGVETRTSSPLRMLRDQDHQSITIKGLFPAGEGSGYAGGIMSSAMDGIKTAEKIIDLVNEGG